MTKSPATSVAGARLELRKEPGGFRHYLAGEPVHAGTPLDLLMADGSWLPGRYENQRYDEGLLARFHMDVRCKTALHEFSNDPSSGIAYPEAAFDLPRDAEFRWPPRRR